MNDTKQLTYASCPMCDTTSIESHMEVKDFSISKETFPIWKCKSCDFHFTQNPPTEATCAPYYESDVYISHSDTKNNMRDRLYHIARDYMLERKWKIIQKHSSTSAKGKLLDVGAGTGYFLNHIQSKSWDVQGIEVSDKARAFCKAHFGITSAPPEQLFQLEEKYDVITLWHVLEHLYDFHKYVAQFRSLLKEDGLLIIAVPNHSSGDAQKYREHWAAYDVPRHLWHFQPSDFDYLTKKHGLQLVQKHAMPLDAFYVSMLSEQYRRSLSSGASGGEGTAMIGGGLSGLLSNLKSIGNADKSSSVIYVMKKA